MVETQTGDFQVTAYTLRRFLAPSVDGDADFKNKFSLIDAMVREHGIYPHRTEERGVTLLGKTAVGALIMRGVARNTEQLQADFTRIGQKVGHASLHGRIEGIEPHTRSGLVVFVLDESLSAQLHEETLRAEQEAGLFEMPNFTPHASLCRLRNPKKRKLLCDEINSAEPFPINITLGSALPLKFPFVFRQPNENQLNYIAASRRSALMDETDATSQ